MADALATAERVCRERGEKLTPQRRRVLEILWEDHRPIGAYDVLARLRAAGVKAYPPTIYRALDFLTELGLAHKIHGANAFVGCARPEAPHAPHFMICQRCHEMRELFDDRLTQSVAAAAEAAGFEPSRVHLEIEGLCARCAAAA